MTITPNFYRKMIDSHPDAMKQTTDITTRKDIELLVNFLL